MFKPYHYPSGGFFALQAGRQQHRSAVLPPPDLQIAADLRAAQIRVLRNNHALANLTIGSHWIPTNLRQSTRRSGLYHTIAMPFVDYGNFDARIGFREINTNFGETSRRNG